jgi:hypothetical protein
MIIGLLELGTISRVMGSRCLAQALIHISSEVNHPPSCQAASLVDMLHFIIYSFQFISLWENNQSSWIFQITKDVTSVDTLAEISNVFDWIAITVYNHKQTGAPLQHLLPYLTYKELLI